MAYPTRHTKTVEVGDVHGFDASMPLAHAIADADLLGVMIARALEDTDSGRRLI